MQLSDQNATMQLLGSLMRNPMLFAETNKYRLEVSDYENKIHKKIFLVLKNLFNSGATVITPVDVDNYLQSNDNSYQDFVNCKGVDFLNDTYELANVNNFDYNYNTVKKLSALRTLRDNNFDIDYFTGGNEFDLVKQQRKQLELESMSLEDIFGHYLFNINALSNSFLIKSSSESGTLGEDIEELIERLKISPEKGFPLQGDMFNTAVNGARLKKMYLVSGSTGSGKTRRYAANACSLAYPIRYDIDKQKWVNTGLERKVLFIATELEKEEIQTMSLAFVSGVNEAKILNNNCSTAELDRITKAIQIMKHYEKNLIFERMADPNIMQVTTIIRKHKIQSKIQYVFYDYIFSSPALLNEYRDLKIREDVALLIMATALKDLANELNLFVMTGTQLNSNYTDWTGIRDQNLIRGRCKLCPRKTLSLNQAGYLYK